MKLTTAQVTALVEHPNDALAVSAADDFRLLASNERFEAQVKHAGFTQPSQLINSWFASASFPQDDFARNGFGQWQPDQTHVVQVTRFEWEEPILLWRLVQQQDPLLTSYKRLFDRNVAGVVTISLEGIVLNCNRAFAHLLGYDNHRDVRYKSIAAHFPADHDRASFIARIQNEKVISDYELELVRTDGISIWCLENSYLNEQNGRPVIEATVMEVTETVVNRRKYESLFTFAMDAMCMVSEGIITDANDQALLILDEEKSSLMGKSLLGNQQGLIVPEESNLALVQHKVELAALGDPQRIKAVCRRGNGTWFHAELKINPVRIGTQSELCVTIRDVTERVLYERALRESEERFKLLSDVAIESIGFVKGETIIDGNDQLARLIGYAKRSQILGKKLTDYVHPEDFDRLRRVSAHANPNKCEVRAATWDGNVMFLEASGTPINYQGEEVAVYLFYDITQRKRTETQLSQSIDRFRNLVENLPNGVFIVTDGFIKYSNASGIELLAAEEEDDIFDAPFIDFFPSSVRDGLQHDLELVRQGEEVEYRESTLVNRKGEELEVGLKASLTVYDSKPSIQVTVSNLTTRMMLLQEKVRSKLAEEINQILKREIEEHKITQKKLIAAQSFTRNIIESSIDMIIAVDQDFCITEFNSAAQNQFGYSSSQVIGKNAELLYADPGDVAIIRAALRKTGRYSGEIVNTDVNGRVFTCLMSASLIRNEEGEVLGSMGVSRDITELKKAERELRESEERYRDIFDNARDFILSIDAKGKVIYANNAFIDAIGYDRDALSKMSIYDLLAKGTIDRRKRLFNSFVSDALEVTLVSKSGEKVFAEGNSSVRYQDNQPLSIRAILRDVTENRANKQRAAEQRARLESIFESTRNMSMWTLDTKLTITSCNRNFKHFMKSQFSEVMDVGVPFEPQISAYLNPKHYPTEIEAFRRAFEGQPQQFEVQFENVEGEETWLQVFLNPVYNEEIMEEISCLSYDITDRKRIDQQVRDSLREKEVLLQEVHHRVKNNLQVISSILNLQSSFVQDDGTLEILQESQNRIKSMSYIHETLYRTTDFSSIEFPEYIQNIVRNLIHTYSFTTGEVALNTVFDPIYLTLDQAIPCGLIINELVSNALKYAFESIELPQLRIEITEADGNVRLLVADNGIGLPENFRYEESDSLGVQLVYTLVEQLDGTIEIGTKAGTRFLITFTKS